MYGLVGVKTHAKCVLVVRREDHRMRRYARIGTGNYNATTAAIYEDVDCSIISLGSALLAHTDHWWSHPNTYAMNSSGSLRLRPALAKPGDRYQVQCRRR